MGTWSETSGGKRSSPEHHGTGQDAARSGIIKVAGNMREAGIDGC